VNLRISGDAQETLQPSSCLLFFIAEEHLPGSLAITVEKMNLLGSPHGGLGMGQLQPIPESIPESESK
jgi:hypothetical protein